MTGTRWTSQSEGKLGSALMMRLPGGFASMQVIVPTWQWQALNALLTHVPRQRGRNRALSSRHQSRSMVAVPGSDTWTVDATQQG